MKFKIFFLFFNWSFELVRVNIISFWNNLLLILRELVNKTASKCYFKELKKFPLFDEFKFRQNHERENRTSTKIEITKLWSESWWCWTCKKENKKIKRKLKKNTNKEVHQKCSLQKKNLKSILNTKF